MRRAWRSDATTIRDLAVRLARSVGDPPPVLSAEDILRDGFGPGRWFDAFVAVRDGELVGHVLACRLFEAHTGGRRFFVSDLNVAEDARGQRLGCRPLGPVARDARRLGCPVVTWHVWNGTAAGRTFFSRRGGRSEPVEVMAAEAAALLAEGDGGDRS